MGDASNAPGIEDPASGTGAASSSPVPSVGSFSQRAPLVGLPDVGSEAFTLPGIGAAIRPDPRAVRSGLAGIVARPAPPAGSTTAGHPSGTDRSMSPAEGVAGSPRLPTAVIPASPARGFGLARLGPPLLALALGVGGCGLLAAVLDDDETPPDRVATSSSSASDGRGASGQVATAPAGGSMSNDPSMRWAVGSGGNTPVCLVAVVDRGVDLRNRDAGGRLATEFSEGVQAIGVTWGLVTFDTSPSTVINPTSSSAGEIAAAVTRVGASSQSLRGRNSMRAGLAAASDALDRCPAGHLPMSLLITDEPPAAGIAPPENFGVVVTPEHGDAWRRELASPTAVSELSSFDFGGPGEAIAEQLRALGLTVGVEVDESPPSSPGGP